MTQSPPSTLPPSRETASRSSSVLRALRFVARMTEREIEKGVGTWYGSFSPLLKRLVGVKLSSNDRECSVPMPDGQAEMGHLQSCHESRVESPITPGRRKFSPQKPHLLLFTKFSFVFRPPPRKNQFICRLFCMRRGARLKNGRRRENER